MKFVCVCVCACVRWCVRVLIWKRTPEKTLDNVASVEDMWVWLLGIFFFTKKFSTNPQNFSHATNCVQIFKSFRFCFSEVPLQFAYTSIWYNGTEFGEDYKNTSWRSVPNTTAYVCKYIYMYIYMYI